jgi:hypothetical protein
MATDDDSVLLSLFVTSNALATLLRLHPHISISNRNQRRYHVKTALFFVITQRVVVISSVKMTTEDGNDMLSRNVLKNYNYLLRNSQEERSSHLLRGGSLESRIRKVMLKFKTSDTNINLKNVVNVLGARKA